jgi:hypothetical protein
LFGDFNTSHTLSGQILRSILNQALYEKQSSNQLALIPDAQALMLTDVIAKLDADGTCLNNNLN